MTKPFLPRKVEKTPTYKGKIISLEELQALNNHIELLKKSKKEEDKKLLKKINSEKFIKQEAIPGLNHDIYIDEKDNLYAIHQVIGQGNFGTLCLAQNVATGEFIALKKQYYQTHDDENDIDSEIKIMSHLGVLKGTQKTREGDRNITWIAQPLIDGEDFTYHQGKASWTRRDIFVKDYHTSLSAFEEVLKKFDKKFVARLELEEKRRSLAEQAKALEATIKKQKEDTDPAASKDEIEKNQNQLFAVISEIKEINKKIIEIDKAPIKPLDQETANAHLPFFNQQLTMLLTAMQDLNTMHQKGVLHLDIKPANMMLDVEGKMHLVDFGLSTPTVNGKIRDLPKGSLLYLSPALYKMFIECENAQNQGKDISGYQYTFSAADDIYAMGFSFVGEFELLRYIRLFNGVVCDKEVGDHFIKTLENMIHQNPSLRPSAQEVINATQALQKNILLKQGLDLLTANASDIINYLDALDNNVNKAIVHFGKPYSGTDAIEVMLQFMNKNYRQFAIHDNIEIINKIKALNPTKQQEDRLSNILSHIENAPISIIEKYAAPQQIEQLSKQVDNRNFSTRFIRMFGRSQSRASQETFASDFFRTLSMQHKRKDINENELPIIAVGMLHFLQDQIHTEKNKLNQNIFVESRLSLACDDIIGKLNPQGNINVDEAKQAFLSFVDKNPDFVKTHEKIFTNIKQYSEKPKPALSISSIKSA